MDSRTQTGLSSADAAQRLRKCGPNELPNPERRKLVRIIFDILGQPMFALLLVGALVYLLLGEKLDAGVLALFATLSVSIGIVQETRSEKVLQSLRALASPRALVIRDNQRQRIPSRELVPGDAIILTEGDRVPADAILSDCTDLLADESLLTGESVPVRKTSTPNSRHPAAPGGDDLPYVFAGTLIVRGSGLALVTATGLHSEMGQIGQALTSISLEQPHLSRQLQWLVRDFAIAAFAVAAVVLLLIGLSRGAWLEAALAAIAVGMSMLPEEIPLVLAVFMAMGAWRISRAGVLTRRAAAIETLGSATVLCTDKTGTLTENRMAIALVSAGDELWRQAGPVGEKGRTLLLAALGASAPIPTDPMDRAVHEAALKAGVSIAGKLAHGFGLRPELPAIVNIWEELDRTSMAVCAKGAPEAIVGLCQMDAAERTRVMEEVDHYAAQGIRILAVARAELAWNGGVLPKTPRDIAFSWLGLIGFADPLRETVYSAVQECRNAGIRVVMITGDYSATARAIAAQAGIAAEAVLTGQELDRMSDEELTDATRTTSIFARIRPQQKLRLVEALKHDGEIVAMTGDGVNDAPAMKAAHIGIAMGGRGTDVAREASALVLLQDDFASIVATVRLGRRIYDNLRKAIEYIVAIHIPIAGLALLPLLFGLPLMLMPIQIALLEMVIDPACSIVFEAEKEERNVMRRPPRPPDQPVLPPAVLLWAAFQGTAALAIVALALFLGNHLGLPEPRLRALVFTVLVLMNVGLILVNRSFHSSLWEALVRPNSTFWILVAAVLLMLTLALAWPPASDVLRFGPLAWHDLLICLGAGACLIGLLELIKRALRPMAA